MLRPFLRKIILVGSFTLCWFALLGQTGDGVFAVKTNFGPYAKANSKQSIYGVLFNHSNQFVSQLSVYWQVNEEEVKSQDFNNISLEAWQNFNFHLNTQWNVGVAGLYQVKVWVDNVNGNPYTQTDTLVFEVEALTQTASRVVLYESFSSTGCGTCALVNPTIRDLAQKNLGKAFFITYQTDCYSGNPMCQLASTYIANRINFYDVQYTPYTVFSNWYSGSSHFFWHSFLDAEYERPSPLSISGDFSINNNIVSVDFEVSPFTILPIENLMLSVAFVQDQVSFANPPGSNGEKDFYHILRRLASIPHYELEPLTTGEGFSFTVSESFEGLDVDLSLFRIGVFLQDTSTFEVIQVAELKPIQTSINTFEIQSINVSPNPAKGSTTVYLDRESTNGFSIKVIDQTGRIAYSSIIPSNSRTYELSTEGLNPGVYIIWVSGPNFEARKRVVLLK